MATTLEPQQQAAQMQAIVCRKPTGVEALKLQQIDKPTVGERDILIRIHASSVNPLDFFTLTSVAYAARWLKGRGRPRPEILGMDLAGTVEAVGGAVTRFEPGDTVFGGQRGAFAEYVAMPETGAVVHKPANVTFQQAAAAPVAALTALQAVRDHGKVRPGQKVLINGASGGVGTFAIQLAKHFGAEVTAVCSSRNVDQAGELGADTVIDYSREDFTTGRNRYDVMLDIAGSHSWAQNARVLKPKGTYVLIGGSSHTVYGGGRTVGFMLRSRLASLFAPQKLAFFIAKLRTDDLTFLADALAAGTLRVAIDRRFDLAHVSEAMAYMGEGHARGKIALTV